MTYFHHIGVFPDDMEPRQELLSPRQICLDVLATYVGSSDRTAPSSGLVSALGAFDITPSAARAAISRLSRKGLLHSEKVGRTTAYALTPDILKGMKDMDRHTRDFGGYEREWDGMWTLAVFNLAGGDQGHQLRNTLRWLGFGPLRDGVWISPHAEPELGTKSLAAFADRGELTQFRARVALGSVDIARAYPLDEVKQSYRDFITHCQHLHYQVRAGEISDRETFVQRTKLVSRWRRFPVEDPDLPASLLESGWPRNRAHEMFTVVDAALAPGATRAVSRMLR